MKRLSIPLVALLLLATGCTSVSAGPDEIGLHYSGGSFTSQNFEECFGPSKRVVDGPGDSHPMYPFGQRTFTFDSSSKDKDTDDLAVLSKDNVVMTVRGVATFDFVRDCEKVRKFHEQIGRKYAADNEEGWNTMLDTYLRQPLDRAMDAASQGVPYRDLYNSPEAKQAWEASVALLAPQFVKEQAGDEYFANFGVTLQRPVPPDSIIDALNNEQKAVAENQAQLQRNAQIQTELKSIEELVRVLGPQGYRATSNTRLSKTAECKSYPSPRAQQ